MHLAGYLRVNTLTCVHSCMSAKKMRSAFILSFARTRCARFVLVVFGAWHASSDMKNKRIKEKTFYGVCVYDFCIVFHRLFCYNAFEQIGNCIHSPRNGCRERALALPHTVVAVAAVLSIHIPMEHKNLQPIKKVKMCGDLWKQPCIYYISMQCTI